MTDHSDFVRTLYAAFGRGDLPTILDNCHKDVEWVSNGDPARIPWTGARSGVDGVTAFFVSLGTHLDFEVFEPRQFCPSGDVVIVLGYTEARHKHAGHGVFACEWVHAFTVRDGRLARFHEFYDTAAIERALAA